MKCPRHRAELRRILLDHAAVFDCPDCSGRLVSVPLLRRMIPSERTRELWTSVRGGAAGDAPCPSCGRAMRRAELGRGEAAVQVDGCATCLVIWFDPGELRAVAPRPQPLRPVTDAPVPPDSGDTWFWNQFFSRLNERGYGAEIRAAEAGDFIF